MLHLRIIGIKEYRLFVHILLPTKDETTKYTTNSCVKNHNVLPVFFNQIG